MNASRLPPSTWGDEQESGEWITQRWEKPVIGYGIRYYEARLQPDLWGQWGLTLSWGRRGTALGRVCRVPVETYAAGIEALNRLSARRRRRGYQRVESRFSLKGCVTRVRVAADGRVDRQEKCDERG